MGRWWSCRLSERCTGPASTSPILLLQAGWLLLSKRWEFGRWRESTENRMKAGKRPLSLHLCDITTVVFAVCRGGGGEKRSRWNKKRRAIRIGRRRQKAQNHLVYEVQIACFYEYACTHTHTQRKMEKERGQIKEAL